jgi:hypothetical protein
MISSLASMNYHLYLSVMVIRFKAKHTRDSIPYLLTGNDAPYCEACNEYFSVYLLCQEYKGKRIPKRKLKIMQTLCGKWEVTYTVFMHNVE